MKYVMLACRDSAVNAFNRPFAAPSIPAGVRSFGDEVNRNGSEMSQHPEDYELWHVGVWEDDTGVFAEFTPVLVVRAKDLIKERA